ncbi:MAG: hypothetical protein ACOX3R_09970 [Desulfitobacteriia bacterium]
MLDREKLLAVEKNNLQEFSRTLEENDLPQLVKWLEAKDDQVRYHSFLVLKYRSDETKDVYPYWDLFRDKLASANSYQRSLGAMLIAANAKWDQENKINTAIADYLKLLTDEKPITVRQSIQSLALIIPYKPHLEDLIAEELMALDMQSVKATMRKLILFDILTILIMIHEKSPRQEIESFIFQSLTGEVLDKKTKKQIEAMLL